MNLDRYKDIDEMFELVVKKQLRDNINDVKIIITEDISKILRDKFDINNKEWKEYMDWKIYIEKYCRDWDNK